MGSNSNTGMERLSGTDKAVIIKCRKCSFEHVDTLKYFHTSSISYKKAIGVCRKCHALVSYSNRQWKIYERLLEATEQENNSDDKTL